MRKASLPKYHQELSDIRVTYSRAGCITSIVLVLAGVGLDFAFYPDWAGLFFLARALAAALTLGIFLLVHTGYGRRHVRVLTLLWLGLPQIMICWMIGITEGEQSIYFVGLTLALYAVGIVVPLTFWEGIGFAVFTCVAYAIACLMGANGVAEPARLMGNSLFIAFSAGACIVCSYFADLQRLRVFDLQEEVSDKNAELSQTNTALAEVKGHMVQQEKMAALGTLSAGLLHEVNNPINYGLMALNVALQQAEAKHNSHLQESLKDAEESMQRIRSIVTDLKTFAYQKPGEDSRRLFLLEKAIDSALRLTSFELKGIEIVRDLPPDTHVLGDEPAVIGVLINLFGNAALALRNAGRLTPRIEIRAACTPDRRLQVRIRDNGEGMRPEHLSRVFEPFFTTRDVGQGLGLGLSVSYSIIQRHGGTLAAASHYGAWTEFSFDLEMAAAESAVPGRASTT